MEEQYPSVSPNATNVVKGKWIDTGSNPVGRSIPDFSSLFYYNPETGILTYKNPHPRSKAKRGEEAGTIDSSGYRVVQVQYKKYRVHRVGWIMTYGSCPKYLDHINRNKLDNRIVNLRETSSSDNQANRDKYFTKSTTSKYKGVFLNKNGKYEVQIWYKKIRYYVGVFEIEIDAARAYNKKATELFGEFAALNCV